MFSLIDSLENYSKLLPVQQGKCPLLLQVLYKTIKLKWNVQCLTLFYANDPNLLPLKYKGFYISKINYSDYNIFIIINFDSQHKIMQGTVLKEQN